MRVIIDTDPGIDDTAAIFLGLAAGLQVEAVTTVFGNTDVEHCTRNALVVLEAAGRPDIPVHPGAAGPLIREPTYGRAIHGENGLGDIEVPAPAQAPAPGGAVEAIIQRVLQAPGEITLLALGPLTNVALALAAEPRLARAVRRIVVMGGAVLTWGNVTPAASANLYNDPEAARLVYRSGAPLAQVGLDVCRPTVIPADHLARLRQAPHPAVGLLLRVTPFIQEAYRRRGIAAVAGGGVQYNDVVCMAYALRPALFRTRHLPVDIETQGALTAGATVADFDGRWGRPANADVALEVDAAGVADFFTETLLAWR
ncbi:MAG: nucleoside hydrolase [Armatimonadota bacterium]|nr:nucleoside hydrolase [Armatimonadota bacterium]MDR7486148.1 nucleoside hydrolase [Armatimonadota bacterium]MDR7531779.1 nucleoside hydrolase [Armatimonadota bacterium]MDR7534876.1 nucleoside hydrolase [Armatimonadota bacterium]